MPKIINPAPPNLPLATDQYERRYQDQFANVLRLYFNQLKNALGELFNKQGGKVLAFPYFSAYQNGYTTLTVAIPNGTSTAPIQVTSTAYFASSGYVLIGQELIGYTTKTATTLDGTITRGALGTNASKGAHAVGDYVSEAAAVTAGSSAAMSIDVVTDFNGVTCAAPDSNVYIENAGYYNIQFSAQLLNFSTAEDNVTIWIKQNGSDVTASAGVIEVSPKHGTSPGATIAGWNYVLPFNANDYFQLYWASDTGNTVLSTYPPGTSPTHPESPSLILTVTFVSALPT